MKLEVLVRLNAKTSSPERAGVTHGALQPSDVAAALAGLPRFHTLLGLAYINGAQEILPELENLFYLRIIDIAIAQHWTTTTGKPYIRYMSQMALWEYLSQPKCRECNGMGHVYPPGAAVAECSRCNGSGNGKINVKTRARMMHMHWQLWRDIWAERYERYVMGEIRECESRIVNHLRGRMGA